MDIKEKEKYLAAEASLELVKPGMKLGLGTGSTAKYAIEMLGERVKKGLAIQAIPTSEWTRALATQHGIPLLDFAQTTHLDLTLDGADEFDPALNLTKGGGGALFREKIVASASAQMVVFADASKRVKHLGAFPTPIEVNPFGWQVAASKIEKLGAQLALRQKDGKPFVSDNAGYILDCRFGDIQDPPALERELKKIVGVMETGLFCGIAKMAIIGNGEKVERILPV